jgi:hypothetical protein
MVTCSVFPSGHRQRLGHVTSGRREEARGRRGAPEGTYHDQQNRCRRDAAMVPGQRRGPLVQGDIFIMRLMAASRALQGSNEQRATSSKREQQRARNPLSPFGRFNVKSNLPLPGHGSNGGWMRVDEGGGRCGGCGGYGGRRCTMGPPPCVLLICPGPGRPRGLGCLGGSGPFLCDDAGPSRPC